MAALVDVAKLAGVSKSTASRALSGHGYVSTETRLRVESAAATIGFVVSSNASSLVTGRSRNVGVVIPFINRWFFGEVLEGIETALIAAGYDLTLYRLSADDAARRRVFEYFLVRKRVDGVIAVGIELGMDDPTIARGFAKFTGVKRRFTKVGDVDGATVIDDYAHHPVEIRAVLSAARETVSVKDGAESGRVIAVVQPHRFTRLRDLMEDFQNAFNDADIVYVAPVYPAGEEPIEGVDAHVLADGLRHHGHRMVKPVENPADLAGNLRDVAAKGDIIVCMGAGDITKWAGGLAAGVAKARAKKK